MWYGVVWCGVVGVVCQGHFYQMAMAKMALYMGKCKPGEPHCPQPYVVRQCTARAPSRIAPCGEAVYRGIPTAHCPMQCGGELKDHHPPLPTVVWQNTKGCPLPTTRCSVAMC